MYLFNKHNLDMRNASYVFYNVKSYVCYVKGLSCLGFVLSSVCLSRVCLVKCLSRAMKVPLKHM